jgi:cobalamin biosynthesis Mg chelatase CobN
VKYSLCSLAAALVLAVGLPTSAFAQDVAPPGNSAVDQYRESAPPASSGAKKVTPTQRRGLERQGRDGAALAAALDRTGGVPTGAGASGAAARSSDAAASSGRAGSGEGVSASDASPGGGTSSTGESSSSSAGGGSAAGGESDAAGRPAVATVQESTTKAAASSAVGPFPVWVMLLGALVVVGVGLLVRRRSAV